MIHVCSVCNNFYFGSVALFNAASDKINQVKSPKFRKISFRIFCVGAAVAAIGTLRKVYRFAPYSAITGGCLLAAASVIRVFWKGSLSAVQRNQRRMNRILAEARAAEAERAEAQARLDLVLRERNAQRVFRADVESRIIEAQEGIANAQRVRLECEEECERGRERLARGQLRLEGIEREIGIAEEEIRRIKAHNPEKEVSDFILRLVEFRRGKADSPEMREGFEAQIVNVREGKKVFEGHLRRVQKEILKFGEKIVACREELRVLGEKRGVRLVDLIAECIKLETELREQFRVLSCEREVVFSEWVEGFLQKERFLSERAEQGKATLDQADQIQERCRAERERCLALLRENSKKSENLEKLKSEEIKKTELLQTYKEKISPLLEEIRRISNAYSTKDLVSEEDREILEILKKIRPGFRGETISENLKILIGCFERMVFELGEDVKELNKFGKEFCEREMAMVGREKEILEIVESFFVLRA
jgi:chromosome segregation ATPase